MFYIKKQTYENKMITDLRNLIVTSAALYGDKPRYVFKDKKTRKDTNFSYNDFLREMNAAGTAFSTLDLMGKTVAVIGDTHPLYVVTYFAVVNGNGMIVPLDKEINDDELVNFLIRSHSEAVVFTESQNARMAAIADRVPGIRYFIPITPADSDEGKDRVLSWEALQKKGEEELAKGNRTYLDLELDLEKPCALLFTSGTTGTSKGILLSQNNLAAATNSSCLSMHHITDETRLLSVLPINHTYEMTCGHLAAANKGCTTYINDSIKYVTKNLASFKPTAILFVPLFVETLYKRIWDNIEKKGITKKVKTAMKISNFLRHFGIDMRKKFFGEILSVFGGELESIVCGGAPLDQRLIDDFDAFGIPILNGYGITECAPLVAVNRLDKRRAGTVGTPVERCEVKVDLDEGQDTGEILVKGGNVMLGYFEDPDATAEVFTEDGWFKTGDVGFVDKDGFVHITGRKKNIIILSNGKNIYPEEIEQYLAPIAMIKECVVVGRKNAVGEIVITALIYPDEEKTEGMTAEAIYNKLKEEVNEINKELPVFKQIHEVEVRETEFEKTTTKKIKRYKVQ
ncbi:MAG: AMP-binding protein [Clostridia bacterium]|nr:AMP-binding protein [Clostridia bacterium]